MLTDKSVRDLLTAFASSDPTPGGGSASAIASAIGASLLVMVSGLPKRAGSDEDRAALGGAAPALTGVQQQLTEAVDLDTTAYDGVVAAQSCRKGLLRNRRRARRPFSNAPGGATDTARRMRLRRLALDQA